MEAKRQDFMKMILDLETAGISNYKLAQMLGAQLYQVQRWAAGSEPKHFIGEQIRDIHAENVPVTLKD